MVAEDLKRDGRTVVAEDEKIDQRSQDFLAAERGQLFSKPERLLGKMLMRC